MSKILLLTLTVLAGYAYADPLAINQSTHATTTITNGTRTHTIDAGQGYSNQRSRIDRHTISSLNSVTSEMVLEDTDGDPLTDPVPVATGNLIAAYAYEEVEFVDGFEYVESTYSSHYSGNYDSVEFRISGGQIGSVSGISHEDGNITGFSDSTTTGGVGDVDFPAQTPGNTYYEEEGFGVFDPTDPAQLTAAEDFATGGPYMDAASQPNVPSANFGFANEGGPFAREWGEPSRGSWGHDESTDSVYSSLYLNPYTR